MRITILAFAQARTALGFEQHEVQCSPEQTPREILSPWHVQLERIPHCRVAIDEAFCDWDTPVREANTLALIPPVSGG